MGYWNVHGYPQLLPGVSLPFRPEIQDLIASPEHLDDYWVDWNSTEDDPYISDGRAPRSFPDYNCLADFMRTSAGTTADGWTVRDLVRHGLLRYIEWRTSTVVGPGVTCQFEANCRLSLTFGDLMQEIDAGCPVILFVSRSGSGTYDHAVLAYGYDDTDPSRPKIAAMDTDMGNPLETIDWWPWDKVCGGGVTLRPVSEPYCPLPGDTNQDGVVNVIDLMNVRSHLGRNLPTNPGAVPADVTGDGQVDISDFLTVRANLGVSGSPW